MVTLIIAKLYINQKSKLTKRYSQHQTQLILVLIYLLARTNLFPGYIQSIIPKKKYIIYMEYILHILIYKAFSVIQ